MIVDEGFYQTDESLSEGFQSALSFCYFSFNINIWKNTNMRFYADDTCIYYCIGKEDVQF